MRLTVSRLFEFILFLSIFTMAVKPPKDTDMWWHLAAGRAMWRAGAVLHADPFSHTVPGKEWVDHSWLAQLILYGFYRGGGFPALALGTAVVITLSLGLVYSTMETSGPYGAYIRGFILLLIALASSIMWVPRPLIFTLLLFAAVLRVLWQNEENPRWLFALPLLFLLWGNLHGGYAGGLILLATYGAGVIIEEVKARLSKTPLPPPGLKRLAGIGALCVAVLFINPNTYKLLLYPLMTVRVGPLREYIQEWASPDFHQLFMHPFIWLLIALLGALGFSPRKIRWREAIPLAAFLYMSLVASRNIPLFALLAGPVLARCASGILGEGRSSPRPARGSSLLNFTLLVVLMAMAGLRINTVLQAPNIAAAQRQALPVRAVEFIRNNHPAGEMFNDYDWGGYLIWELYPEYRVFADGRTTLYGEEILGDYLKVLLAEPGWDEVLDRYRIGFILIKRGSIIARWLERDSRWQKAYEDELAVVFTRACAAGREVWGVSPQYPLHSAPMWGIGPSNPALEEKSGGYSPSAPARCASPHPGEI